MTIVIVSPVDLPVIVADCKSIVDDLGVAARVRGKVVRVVIMEM